MNSEVRNEAFKLRRLGWSYAEINKKLGVPKSTLSGWFSNFALSDKAIKRLESRKGIGTAVLIKRNKAQTHLARQRALATQSESQKEILSLTKQELLLVGTALYWAEGYKRLKIRNGHEITGHAIVFANTDPKMILLFMEFLTKILDIEKSRMKIGIRLYPHMNENETLEYWRTMTKLDSSHFGKTRNYISSASKRRLPYNRLPYGTATISVNDTQKFHRLMGWIEGMKKLV